MRRALIAKLFFSGVAVAMVFFMSLEAGHAQSPEVSAEVDKRVLSIDETVTLSVSVDGAGSVLPPTITGLDGFVLVGRGMTSRRTVVNGKVSNLVSYDFVLRPTRTGTLTVGPVSVVVDGGTHETDPITVEVSQGSSSVQQASPRLAPGQSSTTLVGQDHFVEAVIDNPTPYLGQQVVYTIRYYQAVDASRFSFLRRVRYDQPSFNGFWNPQQSDEREYDEEAAGRHYNVFEKRIILFPTVVGPLTIPPTVLTIPGSIFEQDRVLQAGAVELKVSPLPAGAPDEFNGAVGQFTISAALDATKGSVDEPVTLSVAISGRGNLDTLPDPLWPDMAEWRSFDGSPTSHTQVVGGTLRGTRVYERVLLPERPGDLTVPSISYTYFDPAKAEYRTISTDPLPITIAPVSGGATIPGGSGASEAAVDLQAKDIRNIKPVPSSLGPGGRPLASRAWFWALWVLLPLALVVASKAWRRHNARLKPASGLAGGMHARVRPDESLSPAWAAAPGSDETDHRTLTTYLGEKLNRPVAGLTADALAGFLTARGIEYSVVQRVKAFILASEAGRYAPGAPGDSGDRREELKALLEALEKGFSA